MTEPRLKIITLVILLKVTIYTFGQSAKEQLEIVNSAEITSSEYYEEIPFENKFGYFTIPVRIGEKTYHYIFDTGGYNTLTSQIIADNGLPELMEVEVGSANKIKSKIIQARVRNLALKRAIVQKSIQGESSVGQQFDSSIVSFGFRADLKWWRCFCPGLSQSAGDDQPALSRPADGYLQGPSGRSC